MKKLFYLLLLLSIGCTLVKKPQTPVFSFANDPQATPADTVEWDHTFEEVELYWNSVEDNHSSVLYNLYNIEDRNLAVIDSFSLIATMSETLFTIIKPDTGFYRFGIQAEDEAGNRSLISPSPLLWVSYLDTIPPPEPLTPAFRFVFTDQNHGFATPLMSSEDALGGVPLLVGLLDTSIVETIIGHPVPLNDTTFYLLEYDKTIHLVQGTNQLLFTREGSDYSFHTVSFDRSVDDYFFHRYVVNKDSVRAFIFRLKEEVSSADVLIYVTDPYKGFYEYDVEDSTYGWYEPYSSATTNINDVTYNLNGFKVALRNL